MYISGSYSNIYNSIYSIYSYYSNYSNYSNISNIISPIEQYYIYGNIMLNINLFYLVIIYLIIYINSNIGYNINVIIIESIYLNNRLVYYNIVIISILIMIILMNTIGFIVYSYGITSQYCITLTISIGIISAYTYISIVRNGIFIINGFIPDGTPIILVPLLLIIESISYLARAISLGTRLGANIFAGHTMLHIISGNIIVNNISDSNSYNYSNIYNDNNDIYNDNNDIIYDYNNSDYSNNYAYICIIFVFIIILYIMEIIIGILQGYVFIILSINYLYSAIYLH